MYQRLSHAVVRAVAFAMIVAITWVAYEQLEPTNFALGFFVGFVLVVIGGLLTIVSRRSAISDDDSVIGGATR